MPKKAETVLPSIIDRHQKNLLERWLQQQRSSGAWTAEDEGDTKSQSTRFLAELRKGTATGQIEDVQAREWAGARELLDEVSQARAVRGFTPSQTATFVLSLKEPLFAVLREEIGKDSEKFADEIWVATALLDKLGLYTTEAFLKRREEVIARQQAEMLELSTPVVQLWQGVLAIPLIGTLDSERTQVVMENLLQEIVRTGAEIAIIDITGVPTVDTLVAQHLLKTVSAARLMGADCIISGIRPQIAQTIVHLGVDLSVTSKANLADAFELALRRVGKAVVDRAKSVQARAE